MKNTKITDRDGESLHITDSEDFLCYLSVNNGDMFGVTLKDARQIIKELQEIIKEKL